MIVSTNAPSTSAIGFVTIPCWPILNKLSGITTATLLHQTYIYTKLCHYFFLPVAYKLPRVHILSSEHLVHSMNVSSDLIMHRPIYYISIQCIGFSVQMACIRPHSIYVCCFDSQC